MKNKKMTYLLGMAVAVVWGLIIYRVFAAAGGDGDDNLPAVSTTVKKEPYNDFAIAKDTARLLLNYRDPFGPVQSRDTGAKPVKRIRQKSIATAPSKPAVNWAFIQYSGYIRNPKSKRLITLVSINGKSEMLAEGEMKDEVKLIRNKGDSIKVSFGGKTKFIHLKTAVQ